MSKSEHRADISLRTYGQYRPTACDTAGLGLDDRQAWLVAPCGLNRDSGVRDESNWHAQLKALGGESETCEVHRFGHWACGWFEIAIVDPSRADEIESIVNALASYPILDDNDCSQRESDAADAAWDQWEIKEQALHVATVFDLHPATFEWLREHGGSMLFQLMNDYASWSHELHSDGVCFNRAWARTARFGRAELAAAIRRTRADARKAARS